MGTFHYPEGIPYLEVSACKSSEQPADNRFILILLHMAP